MAGHVPESTSFGDKHYFLIRRLHSLSGLVPLGVFLCFHLLANASVLVPTEPPGREFQNSIERIHALGPLLVPVEIIGIFIPLAFHMLLGIQIWLTSSPNAQQYKHGPNIRYTVQRITGLIAVVFIIYHVWQMHWLGASLGGGAFQLHDEIGRGTAALSTAGPIQAAWWVPIAYIIGVLAVVYHLANGIWTSLITWGITIRAQSQRAAGYICAAFGVALAVVGVGAVYGFMTFDMQGEPPAAAAAADVSSSH